MWPSLRLVITLEERLSMYKVNKYGDNIYPCDICLVILQKNHYSLVLT